MNVYLVYTVIIWKVWVHFFTIKIGGNDHTTREWGPLM